MTTAHIEFLMGARETQRKDKKDFISTEFCCMCLPLSIMRKFALVEVGRDSRNHRWEA